MLIATIIIMHLIFFMIISSVSGLAYNQPKLSPCATWYENATTFANKSVISSLPWGLFVNSNNTVYVAGKSNGKIIIWTEGNANHSRTIIANLYIPFSIFVTINDNIYVDNGRNHNRVDMWTSNSTNSIAVMNVSHACLGLFIDRLFNLYCSISDQNLVVKQSLNKSLSSSTITAAGNGTNGSSLNQLSSPSGIFVELNLNLYVADSGNDRIQLFQFNQSNATTVAGTTAPGTIILNCPTGIILDSDGYLFITDNQNNRIVASGTNGFRCIAGCSCVNGSAANQLFSPRGLSFDSYGNIYVADGYNDRIQKFFLAQNACKETTINDIQSTSMTSFSTISYQNNYGYSLEPFRPPICPNATFIGYNCNISNTPCDILKPCRNNATCHNNDSISHGYNCICLYGFDGIQCQYDQRPCKPHTCWNDGTCNEISNATFICLCNLGWEGEHCEKKINFCQNITCQNNAVCRPLFLNYTCECLSASYSGRHCEIVARKQIVHQIASKSFGYTAILTLILVGMFIVIMDVLKYGFRIDPVREERERLRLVKRAKKRKPVVQKFTYVNAPSKQETTV